MARIKLNSKGDWQKTFSYLSKASKSHDNETIQIMEKYGVMGVEALRSATPRNTGLTAESWFYEINKVKDGYRLEFKNGNMTKMGIFVAILIQYGHGTRNGGYVQGIDFINPALKSVFDEMADNIVEELGPKS